ncbi:MAG: hypothetical protein K0R15_1971 [Clostridiales bacterium]|jgi:hypothetical protein|nr:hypothetical protein [Clostridiales bacterium]
MDQNIQKALGLGVSVLFFVAVVSLGVLLFSQGVTLVEGAEESTSSVVAKLSESDYERYNSTEVSGTSVLNAIKNYNRDSGELIIVVTTNNITGIQYISTGTVDVSNRLAKNLITLKNSAIATQIKAAKDATSLYYINPSAKFDAELLYDENDAIRGISFIQD